MKKLYKGLLTILIPVGIILSCNSEKNRGFRIVFSDGYQLEESDVLYYDSSTCYLFLKNDLEMKVGEGEPPESCTQFTIYINDETILDGGLYPDFSFNSRPLNPIYISSKTYPILESSILPIKGEREIINNSLMLDYLENRDLLRKGILCTIDSLKMLAEVDNCLEITLSFHNLDNINYYIPDPLKMTIPIFNAFGGVVLYDIETDENNSTTTDFWVTEEWNFSMSDFSLLEKKKKITFTYVSPVYKPIRKGLYDCGFMIANNRHYLPFPIPISQENGYIWVGYYYAPFKTMMIE